MREVHRQFTQMLRSSVRCRSAISEGPEVRGIVFNSASISELSAPRLASNELHVWSISVQASDDNTIVVTHSIKVSSRRRY